MRQECIQAVQQAAQRTLTAREIQNIEDRIYRNMRSIARDDPMSWRQLSESERLYRAAQLASEELQREAALKKRRVALTIAARQRLMGNLALLTVLLLLMQTVNRISSLLNPEQKPPVIMH